MTAESNRTCLAEFGGKVTAPTKKFESIKDYLEAAFGPGKIQKLQPDSEAAETRKVRLTLKDDIVIISTVYLGGAYSEITMPDKYDIREIYLLFTSIGSGFEKVSFNDNNPDEFSCTVFLDDPIGKTGPEISFSIKRSKGRLHIVAGGQT